MLVPDAVRAGLAGVHEERHVGEAVAVVGVAAAPDALVHEELDLLLDLREELINVKSIGFGCMMYPTGRVSHLVVFWSKFAIVSEERILTTLSDC